MKNNKAISEIVSYVLLIVIAIGISAMVFAFLKIYIPKAQPECPPDVSLIVQSYVCSEGKLNLTIANRGLWKVDAAYVRFGKPDQEVKTLLTKPTPKNDTYLNDPEGLMPSNSTVKKYNIQGLTNLQEDMEVQITPAILSEEKKLVLCENAIIAQPIRCTLS